jgi:hypothetical protein
LFIHFTFLYFYSSFFIFKNSILIPAANRYLALLRRNPFIGNAFCSS